MNLSQIADPALDAYESMAPWYDAFTASYDHERWIANLERVALGHGLTGSTALDVGCGTGKSFMPLLRRGYDVTACDLSPAMVARARLRCSGQATVHVADMRELPVYGRFDLAVCLDDALNYVLHDDDLAAAFDGIAANLRPGGMVIFDLNSLATYRSAFASEQEVRQGRSTFVWRGEGDPQAQAGTLASATIEAWTGEHGDSSSSRHVQRHHPPALVHRMLSRAGLEVVDVRGQMTGASFETPPDDRVHVKLVYFARATRVAGTSRLRREGVKAA